MQGFVLVHVKDIKKMIYNIKKNKKKNNKNEKIKKMHKR